MFLLKWLETERHGNLSTLCLSDVDAFFTRQPERNCAVATIVAYCQSFRIVLLMQKAGGFVHGIPAGIRSPRLSKYTSGHIAPAWAEVKRVLRGVISHNALDLGAKAIILLFSVYGLRSSEVCDPRLDDFNWRKETFGLLYSSIRFRMKALAGPLVICGDWLCQSP